MEYRDNLFLFGHVITVKKSEKQNVIDKLMGEITESERI